MTNFSEFKQRVHDGGVEAEARPEAWKLLLGLHAPGSTRAERQEEVEQRRAAFQRLRSQWRTMLPGQEAKCSKWRERRTRIDKDVRRTGGPRQRGMCVCVCGHSCSAPSVEPCSDVPATPQCHYGQRQQPVRPDARPPAYRRLLQTVASASLRGRRARRTTCCARCC